MRNKRKKKVNNPSNACCPIDQIAGIKYRNHYKSNINIVFIVINLFCFHIQSKSETEGDTVTNDKNLLQII